jgi:dolichyl-phosphate-mannose-protein mannosyltransferase
MDALRRLGSRAARFAETRLGAASVFGAAVLVWWIQAIAMPLARGRDFGTYVGAFVELFQSDPIDLGYVLGRTPVAPLVTGALLVPFDGALAEPAMSLLYAASILAWFLAARRFGGAAALVTALIVLAYPSYGILMHELSSDSVFAMAFAGWSLLAVRVVERPSTWGWVSLGAGVGLLALVRPLNQVLVLLVVLAFVVGIGWRLRLVWAAAFVIPVVAIIALWTVHNGVRYDDYTLSRAANTNWPIYRVYLFDKLVRPDNGPASREMAQAVREDLLPYEPYRSYGITLERFFEDPSARMLEDMGALANRRWGWHTDQKILRDIAFEAIETHPAPYAKNVSRTVFDLLRKPVFRSLDGGGGSAAPSTAPEETSGGDGGETIVVNGKVLPKPSEGEAIPGAREGGPTTPDNSIRTVWTSPSERHLVFEHPGDELRYQQLHDDIDEIAAGLPDRSGWHGLALLLNRSARWFPPPILWLLAGIAALAWRRPANALALATPAIGALVIVVAVALGAPAIPQFTVPVLPAFALLLGGALLGPRRAPGS